MLHQQKIKKCFNRAMLTYDDHCQLQTRVGEQLIHLVQQKYYLPNNSRILDLGCGTGLVTEKCARAISHSDYHAIDIADQLLLQAKQRLAPYPINVYTADFDHLVTQGKKFDLVFSNMALHWSPHFPHTLKKIQSYMPTRGLLAFSLPLHGTFIELQPHYALNPFYTHERIVTALQDSGYQLIYHSEEKKKMAFQHALAALRSIKNSGANYVTVRNHFGLKGKSLLQHLSFTQLTYVIGYYLVTPRERGPQT